MRYFTELAKTVGLRSYLPAKYAIDLTLWTLAAPIAFVVRYEWRFVDHLVQLLIYSCIGLAIKAFLCFVIPLYRQSWHKVGVNDLNTLLRVVGGGTFVLLAVLLISYPLVSIPRTIALLDGMIGLAFLASVRFYTRLWHEHQAGQEVKGTTRRVLIIGAGNAGTMMAREMFRHPEAGLKPVGFLDDEPSKWHERYLGLPILGGIQSLPKTAKSFAVDEVLIAIPSAPGPLIRKIVELAAEADVPYRIIPGIYDILSGKVLISHIREVAVEDLLRREPVMLDLRQIAAYLNGQTVMITGAGGSIGSELARQVVRFRPKQLVLIDRDENNLYMFQWELIRDHPDLDVSIRIVNIQQRDKLAAIFRSFHPKIVFHAAAYKHVPLMEIQPDEAILNNVLGTKNLIELSLKYDVERFVNISTDKAVHPASIMGASKRVAELIVEHAAQGAGPQQCFVSVRFGNVLGSNGSVVPIFKEQIRRGGPVTITHPEMTRYFMSIPEATRLVLQAASLGETSAVYILDMGQPVKITDLAEDLIRLSGLELGRDVDIEFIGVRPGEKLNEELMVEADDTAITKYDKIHVLHKNGQNPDSFNRLLNQLLTAAEMGEDDCIRSLLKQMIPSYQAGMSRSPIVSNKTSAMHRP